MSTFTLRIINEKICFQSGSINLLTNLLVLDATNSIDNMSRCCPIIVCHQIQVCQQRDVSERINLLLLRQRYDFFIIFACNLFKKYIASRLI
jgi:hypothetical protein